jgi:hypothetical protein
MVISRHLTTFAGLPVRQYDPESRARGRKRCAYRLTSYQHGEEKLPFPKLLDSFLDEHGGKGLTALVIGAWEYDQMCDALGRKGARDVVDALVANRKRMPNLRALFFGDITFDECEISWLAPRDVSALLPAFPRLEEFRIRGAAALTLGKIRHNSLRSFAVESGGLPEENLEEVWKAKLPKLEHLELWLGDPDYGGISDPGPLEPLLSGKLFRKLRYLGLRNSEVADAVARAVAGSPLLERLEVLDLSLGNLTDVGAEALLGSPAVRNLKKLDLHHHFISPPFVAQLKKLPVEVDVSEAKKPHFSDYGGATHVYRFIVASE